MKAFYHPSKTNLKKSETWFCRRKTAEDGDVKINISLNITLTLTLNITSFALLDQWNENNSIEKVKVYFSLVFYDED